MRAGSIGVRRAGEALRLLKTAAARRWQNHRLAPRGRKRLRFRAQKNERLMTDARKRRALQIEHAHDDDADDDQRNHEIVLP